MSVVMCMTTKKISYFTWSWFLTRIFLKYIHFPAPFAPPPSHKIPMMSAHTHKYIYGGQDFTMLQKKGTKLIKAGLKTFNSHCQLCFCDSSVDVVICFEMSPCVVLCVTRKMLFETLSWMKFMDSARRTPYHPVGKIRIWQKRRKKTD